MNQKKVLITGGAGFIGSHLADELIEHGYHVRILDNLSPQVHGDNARRPDYLHPDAEFILGDVRDAECVRNALKDISAVFHFAAAVGVGQSMYEIEKYSSVNTLGTAVILEALAEQPVEKLIVASSMSIYGEGLYQSIHGDLYSEVERSAGQLRKGQWEIRDGNGGFLIPIPTPEEKKPSLSSIYALTKFDQEQMCLINGRAYNIPTVALRFFNVYGTRQALSNPYTGVLAIFASRLLNNRPPMIFEDGHQKRDFVSVYDVARACRLSLETPEASDCVLNIGSGQAYTVLEIAEKIAEVLGKSHLEPQITGKYRAGDIRHCFGDSAAVRRILGFTPAISLEKGLNDLAGWLEGQTARDRVDDATSELMERGLAV